MLKVHLSKSIRLRFRKKPGRKCELNRSAWNYHGKLEIRGKRKNRKEEELRREMSRKMSLQRRVTHEKFLMGKG